MHYFCQFWTLINFCCDASAADADGGSSGSGGAVGSVAARACEDATVAISERHADDTPW